MLVRLLPIVIVLLAVLFVYLSRTAAKNRNDALLQASGLISAPQGIPVHLQGQKRATRIVDGVYVAVAKAKTRERLPVTVIGTHRPYQEPDTIKKVKITTSLHLWIVYPQSYPMPFSFSAGPGEQPVFEGKYADMAELLSLPDVAIPAQTLLATLEPLDGSLWLDNTMLDITLPEDAEVTPLILSQAMDLWRAVREGSEYPFRAE